MNNKKSMSPQWILLPILFSSVSVLAGGHVTGLSAADQAAALSGDRDGFLDDTQVRSNADMSYVGGNSRIGVSVDTDLNAQIEGSHIFSHSDTSATSASGWVGINPEADEDLGEELVNGAGVRVNHHWVSSDAVGTPTHVNKVFGAYDQNAAQDKKVTAGYGQERENLFWSGHVSKSLSDKRIVGTHSNAAANAANTGGAHIYEKAYDYGVGGRVGTFMGNQLLRVQGGLDYEWGAEQADSEDLPAQLTVSGGVEKFFRDSPHSVGADVAVSAKSGGYAGDEHEADVSGNVSYRYDFGNAGLFASDEQYRRVRVEIPGQTEVVKVRTQRAPAAATRQIIKHKMDMDAHTFFHPNTYHLTAAGQQRLRTMLLRLRNGKYQGRIRVIGDTCVCNDGKQHMHMALAKRRAVAVRDFMIKNGFRANEIQALSFNEAGGSFVSTNEDRVVIEYMAQGGRGQVGAQSAAAGAQAYDVQERTRVISKPRVVWRKELIQSGPAWVGQALRNNIDYKQSIDTYRTLGADAVGGGNVGGVTNNTAPTAVNDQVKTSFDTAVMIDVLANDFDVDGDNVSILNFADTSQNGGTITIENGKLIYAPAFGFSGTDNFTYTITDGNGNQANATVTVDVNAPVIINTVNAENDSASVEFESDKGVAINVLGNDSDAQGDSFVVDSFTNPANGSLVNNNGVFTYTPGKGFSGTDSFQYTIRDSRGATDTATVTINVAAEVPKPRIIVNDDGTQGEVPGDAYSFYSNDVQPRTLDVLANDSGDDLVIVEIVEAPRFGTAQISGGGTSIKYTLRSGYCEDHYFVYRVRDKHGTEAIARVNINIIDDDKSSTGNGSYGSDGSTTDTDKGSDDDKVSGIY